MGIIDCIKNIFDKLKKKLKEKKIKEKEALSKRKERLRTLNEGINLPIVLNEIIPQKNEVCHCNCAAQYETKKIITRDIKGHRGATIRITKGFSLNIGRSKSREIKKEVESEDRGQLFITNKRIIFTGQKKNFTVTYTNLIAIKPYNHGFVFQTEKISYKIYVKDIKFVKEVGAILNGALININRGIFLQNS